MVTDSMSKIFGFSVASSSCIIMFDCFIDFKTDFLSQLFRLFKVLDASELFFSFVFLFKKNRS